MKERILLLYWEKKTSKMSMRPIFEAYTSSQPRAQDRTVLGAGQFFQFMESINHKKLLANFVSWLAD